MGSHRNANRTHFHKIGWNSEMASFVPSTVNKLGFIVPNVSGFLQFTPTALIDLKSNNCAYIHTYMHIDTLLKSQ